MDKMMISKKPSQPTRPIQLLKTKPHSLLLLKLLSLLILLEGCVSAPPDVNICIDLDSTSGACVMTISNTTTQYSGAAWQALKNNALVLPSDSWAKLKIYILEVCKELNNCTTVQKKIDALDANP